MITLKIINTLLALSFLAALAGIAVYMYIPSPWQGSLTAWQLHQYGGIAFFILALFHIFLNRRWIKNAFFPKRKKQK